MDRRNTNQKRYILEAVLKMDGHFSADEIYDYLVISHPTISRGTVYRNLNILAEEGKIKKIKTLDGADVFDHILKEHYHIRCVSCKKIYDVDMDVLPDLLSKIKDKQGFEFYGYSLLLEGLCPNCIKEKGEEKNE